MSNWTHVAGIIRVDCIRCLMSKDLDFDKLVGVEMDYDGNVSTYGPLLPIGSEGTLHKSVWINPDNSSLASYTVSVFGDLRDHEDPQVIIEWFKNVCSKLSIRQACITVYNELNGTLNWTYKS